MKSMFALLIALVLLPPTIASACQISSHGVDRAKPDKAWIFFRVIAQDEDMDLAKKKVGDKATKLATALTGAGADAKKIRSSEILEANPEYDSQQSSLSKVAKWTIVEWSMDTKKSEDENLQGIAKLMDAAVATGADVSTFGGDEDNGMFNSAMLGQIRSYDGTQELQQNVVLFSVSDADAHLEQAMKDAVVRATQVAEAIGKIIQDKPQGIDSVSVGKSRSVAQWRSFDLGAVSPTSDTVDIKATLDATMRYSHSDSTVGGGSHSHGDHSKSNGISASGVGTLPVPVEQAVVLHRKSVSLKTMAESLVQLKADIDDIRKRLAEAKLGDHQLSVSGVGVTLGASQADMMYAMSTGQVAKPKSSSYRNLMLTVPRKQGEPLIDFQTRVGKLTAIVAGKPEGDASSSQPAARLMRRYQSMMGGAQTQTFYMALDMQGFMGKLLEAAFADAKAQAERAARVIGQSLGTIHSTHPDEDIPLSDFLSTLKLSNSFSSSDGELNPDIVSQSMKLTVTVEYKTSKPEKK